MNSELYTAASGLLVEERRLELVANNLANLSTPGYRAQRAFSSAFPGHGAAPGVPPANQPVALAGTYETGRGPIRTTGRSLDIAMTDGELFEVRAADGIRYTRAGSLHVSPDGELTDAGGNPVLGPNREPIRGLGPSVRITADGRVIDGAAELGRIRVVRDPGGVLRREGHNLYALEGDAAALETVREPDVHPGWVEASGTDALGELVQLIDAQRAFEGYQKLILLTMNEVNRRAINEIAG